MKFSLATRLTILAQGIFLLAVIMIVLLIHDQVGNLYDASLREVQEDRLHDIVIRLEQTDRELQAKTAPDQFREAVQSSILGELRRTYTLDPERRDYFFILDSDGTVLLHPHLGPGNRSLKTFYDSLAGKSGGRTMLRENGRRFQVYYTTFPPWQWTVCRAVPTDIKTAWMQQLRSGILVILITILVVTALILAKIMSVLVRPVSGLTKVAQDIAEGKMVEPPHTERRDEIGTLARAFVRMQDEIREKIARLHRSEIKYRELVQHANSIILHWDREGRVLYLNDFGRRLFGFSQEEIEGRHVVGTIVAETESSSGRDLSAMIADILERPEAYLLNENENICKDGRRVWIQWSNRAILDEEGRFMEMLSVGIDITERRKTEERLLESENRYRALFDNANVAILIRDSNGICIACNRKALELFGCDRDQLIGRTTDQVTPEFQPDGSRSGEKGAELIRKTLAGETVSLEWQIKRFNDEIRDVRATLSSFEANGEMFIQAVLTDISRQKRMEVELRQAQKMEGIGTLAGGIAHDFNNILSAIIGYTELAQMKIGSDSEVAEDLNQVRKASERASGLVRQILTFSRKQKEEEAPLQINLIVKEALKLIRSSIPATIEIEQEIATSAAVRTDPTLIHQLIMNLCTNAYQAMLETGGKLTVTMREVVLDRRAQQDTIDLPDGRYVKIEVSDTGCGMDQETMEKIFDPFFTTKVQGRGTGLGLAVVHDIVKGLNGAITVLSEPGAGTTFYILLPIENEPESSGDPHITEEQVVRGNERIMVVDDEAAIRELMQSILESSGYRVDLFENGEDAWQALSENPEKWRLVITDQTMPKMTGSQLAGKVLELTPEIPIILCTGYSESVTVEEALEMGIRTYLHKPISLNELLAAVHDALKDRTA